MRAALALAARGLGRVAPNPAVGCVLVRPDPTAGEAEGQGVVVGRGWTQAGGRPHAETEALRRAGASARGTTAYVSLEPCAHHGKTPPCAEALVAAGIARAVIAVEDPDPRVAGRGIERLRAAGIEVEVGLCREQAAELNAGFFLRLRAGRPLVTLKLATTLDGRIATREGDSRWITGEAARARVQALRARHDAVMVGSGTALADDPELTCRLPGHAGPQPVRIVLDRRLRLPAGSRLAQSVAMGPVWVVTETGTDPARKKALAERGVEVIELPAGGRNADIGAALRLLGERGLTRVLVEGGGEIATALLRARLADRVVWFRAPSVIGADGRPATGDLGVGRLDQAPVLISEGIESVGADVLETFRRPG
jgi:diaminohydroxyphosphoribosylaminopyrimidine deaminase/5-amino-6-(5-phosphoribosylamino)uracil reductase